MNTSQASYVVLLAFTFLLFIQVGLGSKENVKDPRIIGGTPADIKDFPYAVSIHLAFGVILCSGSLITPRSVLTAAHCACNDKGEFDSTQYSLKKFRVMAGISTLKKPANQEEMEQFRRETQIRNVSAFLCYEKYVSGASGDDIAMITVDREFDVTGDKVALVQLARPNTHPPRDHHYVAVGWGRTVLEQKAADIDYYDLLVRERPVNSTEGILNPTVGLYYAILYYVTDEECKKHLPWFNFKNKTFCLYNKTASVFKGDSGGPAMYKGVQIGVASALRTPKPNEPLSPVLYVSVSAYLDWIRKNQVGEGAKEWSLPPEGTGSPGPPGRSPAPAAVLLLPCLALLAARG